jgi:propanol-preferring alcohol dehydrogenase
MKSWRFHGTNQPLTFDEVPEPTAGPGEVVVAVKAVGLCHTDVGVLNDPGWMTLYSQLPMTLGHENAGVIVEVGKGMEAWKVGDRVGMVPTMPDGGGIGFGIRDGGYGPLIRATEHNLVRLPDEVSFELGAVGSDAGVTSYHAMVKVGKAKAGMKIGVIGLGGVGYLGARIAVLLGAEVYAADVNPAARALKDELGVVAVAESIEEFASIGLELIVDYAGFGSTTASALEVLAHGGTLVQVGEGRLEATINIYALIYKELTIVGSAVGTLQDLAEFYELVRGGEIHPPIIPITQAEIPEALEHLHRGGVAGRYVAKYDNEPSRNAVVENR